MDGALRRRTILLLSILAAIAGCVSAGIPEEERDTASAPTAARIGAFTAPLVLGETLGLAEPNIAVGPDGRIYVSSAQGLILWRSDDGGRSFQQLNADHCSSFLDACPLSPQDWLVGGADGDLAVLPDGTLVWVGLEVPANLKTSFAVYVQRSTDRGATWSAPLELDTTAGVDRPWIVAHANGWVDVVWGHTGSDRHQTFARSTDGGLSFGPPERFADGWPAGAPQVHAEGAVYVPFAADDHLQVARRSAEGEWRSAHVSALENPIQNFPSVAVDEAGLVYVAWSESRGDAPASVWISASLDGGVTWSTPLRISTTDRPAVFPWIVGGSRGQVALAWYESRGPTADALDGEWDVRIAQIAGADTNAPLVTSASATVAPVHVGSICAQGNACFPRGDRTLGDFFEIALFEGRPAVAFAGDGQVRGTTVSIGFTRVVDGDVVAAAR